MYCVIIYIYRIYRLIIALHFAVANTYPTYNMMVSYTLLIYIKHRIV